MTRLSPEEDSQYIKIEPVRELIADLTLTAHGRGYKVAIFSPADALHPNAAQALLKTLEEPPKRTLILLVTSQPSRLLADACAAAARSCVCRGPTREAAVNYLEAARGAGPWADALAATGAGPFALLDADPAALAQLRSDTIATLAGHRQRQSSAARGGRTLGAEATLRYASRALRAGSQIASSNPPQSAT